MALAFSCLGSDACSNLNPSVMLHSNLMPVHKDMINAISKMSCSLGKF